MQPPDWTATGAGAVIGLAVGPYLTVLITRVPIGQNVLRPLGRCAHCGARAR
jgi:prepilin signal peptidase PulO-like enzyme (type II secretory pathway)